MASRSIPKESLKKVVAQLDAMEKRARKAKTAAKAKEDKQMLGVRVNKIRRAKRQLKRICRAFNL